MPIAPDRSMAQAELFPMAKPSLLIFADASEISGDCFVKLLNEARPTFVLDLRPTPRFDMSRLNRRQVFEIFSQNQIHYIDVAGMAGVLSREHAQQNISILIGTINANLKNCGASTLDGPLLFLHDDKGLLGYAIEEFPKLLVKNNKSEWDVYLAPASTMDR